MDENVEYRRSNFPHLSRLGGNKRTMDGLHQTSWDKDRTTDFFHFLAARLRDLDCYYLA